jgi:hypothetical protein
VIGIDHETRITVLMTCNHWRRGAAGAFALVLCWPARLSAQAEAGVARDAKTHAPLECLHVSLIDGSGHTVANTVTDSAGQFMIEAPGPGVFRVRFESFAWEPQVGPLDTLKEGDFKQRAYPVEFTQMLMPDTTRDTVFTNSATGMHTFAEWHRHRTEPYAKLRQYKRSLEDPAKWQSRVMVPLKERQITYPERMYAAGVTGGVIGRMIVDSNGTARRHSWRTIYATHPDFEKSWLAALPQMRWRPAQLNGSPVCELAQTYVRYDLDGGDRRVDWWIVWFMSE